MNHFVRMLHICFHDYLNFMLNWAMLNLVSQVAVRHHNNKNPSVLSNDPVHLYTQNSHTIQLRLVRAVWFHVRESQLLSGVVS